MPKSQTHPSHYKDCRFCSWGRAASAAHPMQSYQRTHCLHGKGRAGKHRVPQAQLSCRVKTLVHATPGAWALRPLLMWAFPQEITSPEAEAQIMSDAEGGLSPDPTLIGITLFQLFDLTRVNEAIPALKARQVAKFAGSRSGFLPWGKKLLILPLVFLEK